MKLVGTFTIIVLLAVVSSGKEIFSKNGLTVIQSEGRNTLDFIFDTNGTQIFKETLGLALPNASGAATATCSPGQADVCYEWGDYAQMHLTAPHGPATCGRVEWISSFGRRLEDCFNLQAGVHWYGGGETTRQTWPIEGVQREEAAFVVQDFLQNDPVPYGAVVETYWLTSSGLAIHVDEDIPLFISWNTTHPNQVCFVAQDRQPYTERNEVRLKYDLCVPRAGENMKDVHMRALRRYYSIPSVLPDVRMLKYPIWSTWAQYHHLINQTLVLKVARRIVQEGYKMNSHIEIDNNWESCHGEAEFDPETFPDPAGMIQELAELGITRTTLWTHPFIKAECPSFDLALRSGYFVKDSTSKTVITKWWGGNESGLIDFSNENAVKWWKGRLERLRTKYNITSFKFDGVESTWLPGSYDRSTRDSDLLPNIFTTKYVEAAATFGGMDETRAAHRNQGLSFFIRMVDRFSRWDDKQGLQSLIPTLLLFSVLGYSFVLPDMIGGNAYFPEFPSNELYIRWAQANVFMPAWQFGLLPWDRDPTGKLDRIVKAAADLRIAYSDEIVTAANQTLVDGSPMNRPMWWVDPTDPETFAISDQFMLGDNILVAPVVQEGAVSRHVYLPAGNWETDTASGRTNFTGPLWLRNWPATIDVLPFFRKLA